MSEAISTRNYRGGPRTPEGKARSSMNAVKHGLHSKILRDLILGDRLDKRTQAGKAVASFRRNLVTDLGHDPSTAEMVLIERIVAATFFAKALEAKIMRGDNLYRPYIALRNSLRRDLEVLGLRRQPKDLTIDVAEVLARLPADGEGQR